MTSSKKWSVLKADGYTIEVIDQHIEAVSTNQKPSWFPVNSRPRLPISGGRAKINMLGAVTDTGEHFVALTPDSFIAKDLKKQAAGDGLLLEYLPAYAFELNPLKNCWLQIKAAERTSCCTSLLELIDSANYKNYYNLNFSSRMYCFWI